MRRIKAGIALITMFGLLLGTASVANAKTTPLHRAKTIKTTTQTTHHKVKSQAFNKYKSGLKPAKATKNLTVKELRR
jgi:hypothetical protein